MNKRTNSILKIICIICASILAPDPNCILHAKQEDIIKYDTNKDGKIDQFIYLNAGGKVVKVENDGNADGIMDRFQYYEKGKLVRVERDLDNNQKIDCWDIIEEGKRARQEKDSKGNGKIDQIIYFDK
ncbi:MAG: hypothetical protein KJ882_02865, partial [Proteobacteria bacterium]|nr:hypothetical protein [Pseudomonadota bacterium]